MFDCWFSLRFSSFRPDHTESNLIHSYNSSQIFSYESRTTKWRSNGSRVQWKSTWNSSTWGIIKKHRTTSKIWIESCMIVSKMMNRFKYVAYFYKVSSFLTEKISITLLSESKARKPRWDEHVENRDKKWRKRKEVDWSFKTFVYDSYSITRYNSGRLLPPGRINRRLCSNPKWVWWPHLWSSCARQLGSAFTTAHTTSTTLSECSS